MVSDCQRRKKDLAKTKALQLSAGKKNFALWMG